MKHLHLDWVCGGCYLCERNKRRLKDIQLFRDQNNARNTGDWDVGSYERPLQGGGQGNHQPDLHHRPHDCEEGKFSAFKSNWQTWSSILTGEDHPPPGHNGPQLGEVEGEGGGGGDSSLLPLGGGGVAASHRNKL